MSGGLSRYHWHEGVLHFFFSDAFRDDSTVLLGPYTDPQISKKLDLGSKSALTAYESTAQGWIKFDFPRF